MTYKVNDCKSYTCINYYGQCQWSRKARIIRNEVYCENEVSCYESDANIHNESIDKYCDKEK
jgi:hypothetical protein